MKNKIKYLLLFATICFYTTTYSQQLQTGKKMLQHLRLPENTKVIRDIVYAEINGEKLLMDIYIPENQKPLPLVVWIHGGGWKKGSKENCYPALRLLPYGYAVASINYRLTGIASFPAQLEDCKSAIRYLRANGAKYNLNTEKIGVWGSSAGGHLAALLGTTGDISDFDKGDYLEFSSKVQAVCDYYGPSSISDMHWRSDRYGNSPEQLLIGKGEGDFTEKAKKASPVTYVNNDSAPFFIVHGDKDNVVHISQSKLLYDSLLKAGVDVEIHIIKGAGHGGPEFTRQDIIEKVVSFFDSYLKNN
ncbi:MAG: alpha/beta hydrolase [Candidatus Omnitrophica bacterium]|nr:alpha/beta hydrolase [Candidatus Omnitrophota bacterium]